MMSEDKTHQSRPQRWMCRVLLGEEIWMRHRGVASGSLKYSSEASGSPELRLVNSVFIQCSNETPTYLQSRLKHLFLSGDSLR